MKTLNFTDRLSYLAWRKEWKAAYKQISQDIRNSKAAYKVQQRRVVIAIVNAGKPWQANEPTIDGERLLFCKEYSGTFNIWKRNVATANELLELLIKAKEKSAEQRKKMVAERFPEIN